MANVAAVASRADLGRSRVTFLGVLRSEWTKFRTIRSSYIFMTIALVVLIGLWSVVSAGFAFDDGPEAQMAAGFLNPVSIALRTAVLMTQLVIGVWGVTMVTNEYATGMIRATFAAVPKRIPVILAKALLLLLVSVGLTVPGLIAAFFIGNSILANAGLEASINDPNVIRALVGASLYIAGVGLFGSILGWLLRSAAGAIATLVGIIILLPVLLPLIPVELIQTISEYLPSPVGQRIFALGGFIDEQFSVDIDPWTGFAIFWGYVVVGLIIVAMVVRRRDA